MCPSIGQPYVVIVPTYRHPTGPPLPGLTCPNHAPRVVRTASSNTSYLTTYVAHDSVATGSLTRLVRLSIPPAGRGVPCRLTVPAVKVDWVLPSPCECSLVFDLIYFVFVLIQTLYWWTHTKYDRIDICLPIRQAWTHTAGKGPHIFMIIRPDINSQVTNSW